MKKLVFYIISVAIFNTLRAQNVGIGTTAPHASGLVYCSAKRPKPKHLIGACSKAVRLPNTKHAQTATNRPVQSAGANSLAQLGLQKTITIPNKPIINATCQLSRIYRERLFNSRFHCMSCGRKESLDVVCCLVLANC
jgi:hypothetical protein